MTVKNETPSVPWHKLAIELGPLVVFFVANWRFGIFAATSAFMVAMVAAMALSWFKSRHIPPMLLVTGVMVGVFGGLTLWLQDDAFIKLKPTLVNLIFAAVMFYGLLTDRPVLKMLMQAAFPPISAEGWRKLTRNWGWFFLLLALVNEVVWRNFSTDFWVGFKLWGTMPLTFLFMLIQVPVMMKHVIEETAAE